MILPVEPHLCGMGEGPRCCAFLVNGKDGFVCGREMKGVAAQIRERLRAGTMNAQYDPGETPYPRCQSERT